MPEHMPAPTFSRAVYGFVLYLTLKTLFVLYLIWAFVPDWILCKYLNISYIPQKHWAVAVPILCLNFIAIFVFVIYPALNFCMTPHIDDMRTITDSCAKSTIRENKESSLEVLLEKTKTLERFYSGGDGNGFVKRDCSCKYLKRCIKYKSGERTSKYGNNSNISEANYSVPPVQDISISNVCKNLYL